MIPQPNPFLHQPMQSLTLQVQTAFIHLSQSYSPKDCRMGYFPAKSGISSCDDDDEEDNNNNNSSNNNNNKNNNMLRPPAKKPKLSPKQTST
jgi:hypothetical protein